jgi:hypothetical protein
VRIPAAVLRDASPGGGMQRVLSAAAAFLASAGDADLAAPANKAQARPSAATARAVPPADVARRAGLRAADARGRGAEGASRRRRDAPRALAR